MIGGLWKSTSTAALFAAAGLFVGGVAMPSAKAADLGGDCCADLEERVAELEATTARKGNRRMSLTVSGQVTRSILYWNDGDRLRNVCRSGQSRSVHALRVLGCGEDQPEPDGRLRVHDGDRRLARAPAASTRAARTAARLATFAWHDLWAADGLLAVRTANWWLEDKNFGRVTVGRLNFGGPVGTIDLGGISTVAHASPSLVGGGFMFKTEGGAFSNVRMATIVGPTYGGDRIEGIRWDSPTIGGFVAQATWGEDEVWSASLRYAGEFGGFRVAAGIGYQEQDLDNWTARSH